MLAAVLTLLPPAGCVSVGPDFEAPDPLLPSVSFIGKPGPLVPNRAPAAGDVSPVDPAWWTAFRDPILTSLAGRVAAANLDVNSATLKLAESRSQLGVVASAALPAINGDASYHGAIRGAKKSRQSRNAYFWSAGSQRRPCSSSLPERARRRRLCTGILATRKSCSGK
jgi:outer membrane protein TolC